MIEGNPAIYTPGATSSDADRRRLYAGCRSAQAPCDFASVGIITNSTNSTYHSAQLALSRRFSSGLSFLASYTLAKSLDYVSSFNVVGSAPRLVAGENDLAQNPFNLAAEHGPSLFDARHRFVFSGSYEIPLPPAAAGWARAAFGGWQVNAILNFASGTPFTVYDSANVSLQGSAPEVTGFFSSRPNAVSDANVGSHTPDQWMSRSAFQRLNPQTQAGQFGNLGRNTVRGPGVAQRRPFVTEDDARQRARPPAIPRRMFQPDQSRQLRVAGQRHLVAQLRPRAGVRPAAPAATGIESDLLSATPRWRMILVSLRVFAREAV